MLLVALHITDSDVNFLQAHRNCTALGAYCSCACMQAKPVGSHNTNFATRKELQAPVRPANQMESVPLDDLINLEGPGGSPGSDLMRGWFSGFLRSREIAEIDRAIRGDDAESTAADEQPPHNRPWGPLQVRCILSFGSDLFKHDKCVSLFLIFTTPQ